MEQVSWKDKVIDVDVLQGVNETRSILGITRYQKHSWIGHVLRHDGFLKDSTLEGKIIEKPPR